MAWTIAAAKMNGSFRILLSFWSSGITIEVQTAPHPMFWGLPFVMICDEWGMDSGPIFREGFCAWPESWEELFQHLVMFLMSKWNTGMDCTSNTSLVIIPFYDIDGWGGGAPAKAEPSVSGQQMNTPAIKSGQVLLYIVIGLYNTEHIWTPAIKVVVNLKRNLVNWPSWQLMFRQKVASDADRGEGGKPLNSPKIL